MMKNQNYNPNLREAVHYSIMRTKGILGEFFAGVFQFPVTVLIIPTASRYVKNEFKNAKEQKKESLGFQECI